MSTTSGLPASTRALLDAVVAISADLDLSAVLQRIIDSAAELTGARYGALGVVGREDPEEDEDYLVHLMLSGLSPEQQAKIRHPRGLGLLAHLIHHPEPLRLNDLSAHPDSVGFPANHPAMTSFLGVPIRVRGEVYGNLYLTEKSDGTFDADDEELVTALADVAGFVIDHAYAYGRSEQRRRWLEATARVTALVDPDGSADAAFQVIAAAARSGARARAAVVVPDDPAEPLAFAVDEADAAAIAQVIERLRDRSPGAGDLPALVENRDEARHVVTLALQPHLAAGGRLVVIDPTREPRDREWADLLATFADHAALTLDRLGAVADRAQLAVLGDRERIARDLHDVVIQRLFATGLQLQGMSLKSTGEMASRLSWAVDALDQTIRDIRGTIFELQHSSRDTLRARVRGIVREFQGAHGMEISLAVDGPLDTAVPGTLSAPVQAVLREALSNVARHAGAKHAWVQLTADATSLVVRVADDGIGIASARDRESGLRNMRERAVEAGGAFELGPRDPRGTELCWRVPLRDD